MSVSKAIALATLAILANPFNRRPGIPTDCGVKMRALGTKPACMLRLFRFVQTLTPVHLSPVHSFSPSRFSIDSIVAKHLQYYLIFFFQRPRGWYVVILISPSYVEFSFLQPDWEDCADHSHGHTIHQDPFDKSTYP